MPPDPHLSQGYLGLFILLAFVGSMVWIMWLSWRRSQFDGVIEVSAAEQTLLAQKARAFYVDPTHGLCKVETPSDFDRHLLSLFDSIEENRDDIDAKLENLRAYLKSSDMWQRFKNKRKLDLVYGNMAAYLTRPRRGRSRMGMQQLLASWGKVGRLVNNSEGPSRVPATWIRPLTDSSLASLGPSRGDVVGKASVVNGNLGVIVGALFLAVIVTLNISIFRPGVPTTTWLVLGFGIFLAGAAAFKLTSYLAHRR